MKTKFPPKIKPLFIWDGECSFCKYWIIRLKMIAGCAIQFVPFQEIAKNFKDIPLKEFKKASHFIDLNGKMYSGPDSFYKTLAYIEKCLSWHKWYHKFYWFQRLNDSVYGTIAKNRPLMFRLTKLLFGKNPEVIRLYWLWYLLFLVVLITVLAS